jgi:type I restriction enzyme S subunit
MVPNGWERKPIKELCESIIDCVNKTAKHVDYVTPYKMIRTTNVRNGRVDTNNVRYVEKDTYTQWIRRGAPQNGDIIFTREAPVGEAGILENAQGIFLGQRTMMYRAHPDKSDNKYIFYSLMSGYCQKQIEDFSNGGTVAHMRVPDCGELIINTPPLPEQRKIAKILSTWDRGIATTEKLIETSKQQKKALMQQLLTGKKRLIDPETGKAFEGEWEYIRAGSIFSTRSNKKHNSDLPILAITQDQGAIPRELIDYNVSVTEGSISGYKVVEIGDFIISLRSFQGGIEYSKYKGICSPAYVILYPKVNIIDDFYIYHLKSHPFIQAMKSKLEGIRDGKIISYKYFSEIKLPVPTIEEQKKISAVLTTTDKDITMLKAKLAHFKQEKKALMQQLLTGKRRVKVDEVA